MLNSILEGNLQQAKHAFSEANSENIIDLCEKYLVILNEFRGELQKFRGAPEISLQQTNPLLLEETLQKRREIFTAITFTVQELNKTTVLLSGLTAGSGYEAAETFNRLKYKGVNCWEFRGAKIAFNNCAETDQISVQEAVDIAIGLRCKEFIAPSDFN
jgi:hypothetical protein